MSQVLVVAETKNGIIKQGTLELLSRAKHLDLTADAVLAGDALQELSEVLGNHGAETVYLAEDSSLTYYTANPYTALIVEALERSGASQIWFSASEMGKDLVAKVAARKNTGGLNDVTRMESSEGQSEYYRGCMAGKVIQQCSFKTKASDSLQVLSFRSGHFDVSEPTEKTPSVVSLSIPEVDPRVSIKECITDLSDEVDLSDARIVVSAGRGVKGKEGVELVRSLATYLEAGFGASRAVCDAEWMPRKAQVGQTGTLVTPDVYFAIGISGAIQHLAGMSASKVIVAINKDPDAPIFNVADYGIVGDLFKVLPLMLEALKQEQKQG